MPFATTSTPSRKQQSCPKLQGLLLKICAQTFPICISLVLGPRSHLSTSARQQTVDQRSAVLLAKACWRASMKVSKRVRDGRRSLTYLFGADVVPYPTFNWLLASIAAVLAPEQAWTEESSYGLEALTPVLEYWTDWLWSCQHRQSTASLQ